MTSKRKFFKNTITFVVLTEDEPVPDDLTIEGIMEEATDGGWSAGNIEYKREEVDGKQMAQLLSDQASDPGFFELDEDGNDTEYAWKED